jgi:hypothetical protein
MEVLAAIAYPCIRTERDYIGRKTAAKAKAGAAPKMCTGVPEIALP